MNLKVNNAVNLFSYCLGKQDGEIKKNLTLKFIILVWGPGGPHVGTGHGFKKL